MRILHILTHRCFNIDILVLRYDFTNQNITPFDWR